MTNEEMLAFVISSLNDSKFDSVAPLELQKAKSALVNHLYPYKNDAKWEDVPEKYHIKACEIAIYLVDKRGAEGETSHSENGVSRSYESAGIPSSYFDGIIPFAGVPQ